MANTIKKLAGQTAVYGLSSIIGRLLNYLLVPVYTNYFLPAEFGVITELYSYVAILIVVMTHGMETAFFRFAQREINDNKTTFGTSLASVFSLAGLFVLVASVWSHDIAAMLRYPDNAEYVLWFGIIIGLDALMAVPFARLRAENRPILFASIKLTGIGINILLVLFFVMTCPWLMGLENPVITRWVSLVYDPTVGVGYVFIANLVASSVMTLLLLPVIFRHRISFSLKLWKEMIMYALPLLVAGLAGILNEALDKILLKYMLPEEIAMAHVGIYGACYKVSVLMILFIQAFRFAAEPFFFAEYKNENAKLLYARVMKVFVVTCLFIFLGIMLFMDVIQYFIGRNYREGLEVVPILLVAHILLGVYFNLSIWYKLTGQTLFGAYIAVIGAAISIAINVLFIPVLGYMASAWAHLICNLAMTIISWYWGRSRYHVPYDFLRMSLFLLAALAIWYIHSLIPHFNLIADNLIRAAFVFVFAVAVLSIDKEARDTLRPFWLKMVMRKTIK